MADSPLDTILKELDQALQAGLCYMAVTSALTLPDICAALAAHDGQTSKEKYIAWCEAWLQNSSLSPKDLYSLRCGVVHNGKLIGHKDKLEYSRVIFSLPGYGAVHNVQIAGSPAAMFLADPREAVRAQGKNPLFLDSISFCQEIIAAVRAWFAQEGTGTVVRGNMTNVLLLRPNGLTPYVNWPVIA
jgi:hypothetical protein